MNAVTNTLDGPILVTGAAGFIGQRLIGRLLKENYEVIAFVLPNQDTPKSWQDKVQIFHGDITNEEDVNKAIQNVKAVFHFAAIVADWGGEALHKRVTVDGTEYVMNAALKHQCKVILASSITVYSDNIDKGVCTENSAWGNVLGPYSHSKQTQELIAQRYINKGLDVRIVRPANIYGSGSKPWVDDLSVELLKGTPVLVGGGNIDAGLVHVENVVELMLLVASNPKAKGQVFNVCDEENITWSMYINELAHILGAPAPRSIPKVIAKTAAVLLEKLWRLFKIEKRPPLTREALNLVSSHHQISIEKAKSELGYQPIVNFKEGMEDVKAYVTGKN